jgi:hypothetical protein
MKPFQPKFVDKTGDRRKLAKIAENCDNNIDPAFGEIYGF